jgi:hypothetical protein
MSPCSQDMVLVLTQDSCIAAMHHLVTTAATLLVVLMRASSNQQLTAKLQPGM